MDKYVEYEKQKRILQSKNLSAKEYEQAIRRLAEKLKI